MPYEGLEDGLYLVQQRSTAKGVDHYGILDVGNRLRNPNVAGRQQQPVVIHQTPPSLTMDWLQDTGAWKVLGRITDERDAIDRMNKASETPNYNLFGNNCEHFARYVATGLRESKQVQSGVFVAGLALLVYVVSKA